MDRLEEFIRDNREELDRFLPPVKLWKKICRNIRREKRYPYKWLYAAAVAIIAITVAAGFFLKSNNFQPYSPGGVHDYADLRDIDTYYGNIINAIYSEAVPLLYDHPEIEKELNYDIKHLDSIFLEIRRDLKDDIASEEVVSALIRSYRIKIRLLEDMLAILRENESSGKRENYEL